MTPRLMALCLDWAAIWHRAYGLDAEARELTRLADYWRAQHERMML